jgi:NAD kinase
MKALVYINSEKDVKGIFKEKISSLLNENGIEYLFIRDNDFDTPYTADALFIYGGDGTILDVVSFSCKNNIPIIAINSGKLGFLAEFEENEIEEASKNEINRDYKSALQQFVQSNGTDKLTYICVAEHGPDHAKLFDIEVKLNSNVVGKGTGKTKREAEQRAAKEACVLFDVKWDI